MISVRFVQEGKNPSSDLISNMKKNKGGVVILLNRPYNSFITDLKKAKLSVGGFLFIDTVGTEDSDNVICVPIKGLTALSISISEALQRLPSNKRKVIFDSLDAFLVYHDENTFIKFLIFIINNIRQIKADAYMLVAKASKDRKFYSILVQNSDKIDSR